MKILRKLSALVLATLLLAAAAIPAASALEPFGNGLPMRNWLKNDPNYQFSEEYKTSVWYENFATLELTENDRNNVLRIAVSQLGYHEGDSAKDFDGKNTSGSSNFIEYARLLIPHYNNNAYEWCACFVNWCLNQARFDKASSEIGCWKWVGELKTMKMWQDSAAYKGTYTPKPADFIFFNWKHAQSANNASGHIGYVLYTTETHVYTIEGNADNNVTVRSYALNDPSVIGYGTPPYDEGDEPTIDYSYKDGMPRGTYVVNSATENLMREPGKGRIARIDLGSTVVVYEVNDGTAYVRYGDEFGYMRTKDLYLMTPSAGDYTVTYDANGGENPPEADKLMMGQPDHLSSVVPSLEGDTFLGWSTVPYDTVPTYLSGSVMTAEGDITLYAVWEKRSDELADTAFAEGKAPLYTRPEAIENSSALLMGTLEDLSLLTGTDTEIKLHTDDELGQVLSLSATESADPYVTLDYAAWMKALRYAPVDGGALGYAVLKVKNVSLTDTTVEISFNGGDKTASATLAEGGEWQYLVIDLSKIALEGTLESIRLDWTKSATAETATMYLADIFFASNEAQANALAAGHYIYPAEEQLEPETETEPTTDAPTEEPTTPDNEGCTSVLSASSVVMLATLGAVMMAKKKED